MQVHVCGVASCWAHECCLVLLASWCERSAIGARSAETLSRNRRDPWRDPLRWTIYFCPHLPLHFAPFGPSVQCLLLTLESWSRRRYSFILQLPSPPPALFAMLSSCSSDAGTFLFSLSPIVGLLVPLLSSTPLSYPIRTQLRHSEFFFRASPLSDDPMWQFRKIIIAFREEMKI